MANTKATEATKNAAKEAANETVDAANQAVEQASGFASKLTQSGKALVAGTIEVDKMILGHMTEGAKETFQHGRSLLGAKDIKTAFEMQAGFVQNGVEKGFANTREIFEFTQSRLQDVMNPFRKSA